jgi:hypothetical protein
MSRPTDEEIAMAICCGQRCRTDTTHCHASDHMREAKRVRHLLERYQRVADGAAVTIP